MNDFIFIKKNHVLIGLIGIGSIFNFSFEESGDNSIRAHFRTHRQEDNIDGKISCSLQAHWAKENIMYPLM
jgi:hypothetical protein